LIAIEDANAGSYNTLHKALRNPDLEGDPDLTVVKYHQLFESALDEYRNPDRLKAIEDTNKLDNVIGPFDVAIGRAQTGVTAPGNPDEAAAGGERSGLFHAVWNKFYRAHFEAMEHPDPKE
jgi:hypothetical protein